MIGFGTDGDTDSHYLFYSENEKEKDTKKNTPKVAVRGVCIFRPDLLGCHWGQWERCLEMGSTVLTLRVAVNIKHVSALQETQSTGIRRGTAALCTWQPCWDSQCQVYHTQALFRDEASEGTERRIVFLLKTGRYGYSI